MKMNKTVCNCYNVTIQDVKDAIDKGAANLDEVKEATSAATCCGAVTCRIFAIVARHLHMHKVDVLLFVSLEWERAAARRREGVQTPAGQGRGRQSACSIRLGVAPHR